MWKKIKQGFALGVGLFVYGAVIKFLLTTNDIGLSQTLLFILSLLSLSAILLESLRKDKGLVVWIGLALIVVCNLVFDRFGTVWLIGSTHPLNLTQTVFAYLPIGFLGLCIVIGIMQLICWTYIGFLKLRSNDAFEKYIEKNEDNIIDAFVGGIGILTATGCWFLCGIPL